MAEITRTARLYEPGDATYTARDFVVAAEADAVSVDRVAGEGLVLVLKQAQYDAVAAWFRRKPKRVKVK